MPQKIINDLGEEIEVFTAEEKDAAIEGFKQANPDKSGEIEKLQTELTKTQEDLKKFQDKDLNFANLRSQKEAAEKRADDLKAEIDTKIGVAKKEILEGVMQDHYSETLKSLAGEDAELQKKIEFQYKRLGDAAATKTEVTKKLTDAYVLATAPEDRDALNTAVISSAGVSRLNIQDKNKNFTPEEKAFAQKLAQASGMKLEDKDFNK